MTYRTLAIVALTLATGTAFADCPRQGGMRGPDTDNLAIVLELDDQQKQQFEQIMSDHRAAAEARREAHRASGERPDRETIEATREQMRASLRAQLDDLLLCIEGKPNRLATAEEALRVQTLVESADVQGR